MNYDETLKRAEAFLIEEIARRVSDQHTYGFSVSDAFGRRLDFAFPHTRHEPWYLTDGHGHSRTVRPWTWAYYRLGRAHRTKRFNARPA